MSFRNRSDGFRLSFARLSFARLSFARLSFARLSFARLSSARGGVAKLAVLGLLAYGVSLEYTTLNDGASIARASLLPTDDEDGDLLLDEFEEWLGLSPFDPDSDGDGLIDGFEFLLESDPKDPTDVASIAPGFRMGAYFDGNDILLTLYFLPGEEASLDNFTFYAVAFDSTNDFQYGIDLSSLVGESVSEFNRTSSNGFSAASYTMRLPFSVLDGVGMLCLGSAAKIVGETMADVMVITVEDGVPLVLRVPPGGLNENAGSEMGDWDPLTDEAPPGWGVEEVCQTVFSPCGSQGIFQRYQIDEARCERRSNRFCPASACAARQGSKFLTFDYGFLIADINN